MLKGIDDQTLTVRWTASTQSVQGGLVIYRVGLGFRFRESVCWGFSGILMEMLFTQVILSIYSQYCMTWSPELI